MDDCCGQLGKGKRQAITSASSESSFNSFSPSTSICKPARRAKLAQHQMTKSRGKQSFFTGKKPTHHSRSKERCHIIVWRQIGLKARDKHGQTTAITKCKRLYFYHSLTFQKSFLTKTACLEGTPVQQALLLAYATKMEFISKPVDWKPAAEAANTWQANRRSFQNSSTHSIFTDTFFSKTGTLTHQSSIS